MTTKQIEIKNNSGWTVSEKVKNEISSRFSSNVEIREGFEDEDIDGVIWLPVHNADGEFLDNIDLKGNWQA
jgi:hypothetical protein